MARDKIHQPVKTALIEEGWRVSADPLSLKVGKIPIQIDLGAEKIVIAEKGLEKIAVEIKTFSNPSFITALYEAVGKYVVYRKALQLYKSDRILYLAIPYNIYLRYSKELLFTEILDDEKVNLILFDTKNNNIKQWIKR